MNPFDEIIHQMQVETSLYARLHLGAPWGIRFHTGEHARLVAISGNDCWLRWEGITDPVRLAPGTCMIVQPQVTFDLSDAPEQRMIACETLVTSETEGTVAYGGNGVRTEIASARAFLRCRRCGAPVSLHTRTGSLPAQGNACRPDQGHPRTHRHGNQCRRAWFRICHRPSDQHTVRAGASRAVQQRHGQDELLACRPR